MILYAGGYISQFICNYDIWRQTGGFAGDGTSPLIPSPNLLTCLRHVFNIPYGLYGIFICVGCLLLLWLLIMKLGFGEKGAYDRERNLVYSTKGTYGTSGFMDKLEMEQVLEVKTDIRKCNGVILGQKDGRYICLPDDTSLNRNMAVYGASGSMKSRAFCRNMIFQST